MEVLCLMKYPFSVKFYYYPAIFGGIPEEYNRYDP